MPDVKEDVKTYHTFSGNRVFGIGPLNFTVSIYDSFRELPAGKGFADLVFVPKTRPDLPIMIIEFKRDYTAEDALNQIKEQDYAARYRKDGDEREVLLIGLNYSSETKEHHCLIEKM
ncbi:MAG: PD-(D/E)XK nuclease domain-containing protein [Succinimonas sp.]|nr:PD-(D/E)XK nuclease domain-containing protein [Succinimonas sp.]